MIGKNSESQKKIGFRADRKINIYCYRSSYPRFHGEIDMGKIRCQKCGMVATVPDDIGPGENYLSDSAICPTSGLVIRCARCGNVLVGPTEHAASSCGQATGPVSVPQGSVQCPKCGNVFKPATTCSSSSSTTSTHSSQQSTSTITCPKCHRPGPKPKISKSILNSSCGTIEINCSMCNTVIFKGTAQAALSGGYVDIEP